MKKFSLYLNNRLYWVFLGNIFLFALSYAFQPLFVVGLVVFYILLVLLFVDFFLLYQKSSVNGVRQCASKLSNGDDNPITVKITNQYAFDVTAKVIDEIPFEFQYRNFWRALKVPKKSTETFDYHLRPVKRGEYDFGSLNVYVATPIGLLLRRYRFSQNQKVPVYPSFIQMRKYELLAISNRLQEAGVKKVRRKGQNREFDQIVEYVQGDDIRTINWKASARHAGLMVNHYQDEKSQRLYCIIDKGRTMKMPFEKLSLLDYSINASLVISRIALIKGDRVGLLTFNKEVTDFVKASNAKTQMTQIVDALYKQQTNFMESDLEELYMHTSNHIKQRSLVLFFTNFESASSMQRQLPYLRKVSNKHVLVVIFFQNTKLQELTTTKAKTVEDIYLHTVAQKFEFEKRTIVKELRKYGIHALLSTPENLTVSTINKYLEVKSREQV